MKKLLNAIKRLFNVLVVVGTLAFLALNVLSISGGALPFVVIMAVSFLIGAIANVPRFKVYGLLLMLVYSVLLSSYVYNFDTRHFPDTAKVYVFAPMSMGYILTWIIRIKWNWLDSHLTKKVEVVEQTTKE